MERTYKTMKVRTETLETLRLLRAETGLPMITIIEKLVRAEYDRICKEAQDDKSHVKILSVL